MRLINDGKRFNFSAEDNVMSDRFTVKDVDFYPTFPGGGTGWTASLYLDGEKVGEADNAGRGGGAFAYIADDLKAILEEEAQTYLAEFRPDDLARFGVIDGVSFKSEMFLEALVDDWLDQG